MLRKNYLHSFSQICVIPFHSTKSFHGYHKPRKQNICKNSLCTKLRSMYTKSCYYFSYLFNDWVIRDLNTSYNQSSIQYKPVTSKVVGVYMMLLFHVFLLSNKQENIALFYDLVRNIYFFLFILMEKSEN